MQFLVLNELGKDPEVVRGKKVVCVNLILVKSDLIRFLIS